MPSEKESKDELPAWAELKTKAGKERKRLPLACIACRRKKIRCSGESPICKHCSRANITCIYASSPRRSASQTDRSEMSEKRAKQRDHRPELAETANRRILKPLSTPSNPDKMQSSEELTDDWAQTRHANAIATPASRAGSADTCIPRKVSQDSAREGLSEGLESLPTFEMQQHLAEVYFDNVYGQTYHLLHKPTYMRRLMARQVPPVLNLTVCAMAARFSTHPYFGPGLSYQRGEEWAKPARDIAMKHYDSPNLTIIIVYLILGLHEFGTCQGGRSWMFGGMAQRMAYALQLHKDLDHDTTNKTHLTRTDREIRRRTMWACFMMDRFCSSGTDRPPFVAEQYIEAQLPVKESFYRMEIAAVTENLEGTDSSAGAASQTATNARKNMGCSAYVVRAIYVWGNVVRYVNLGGKEKDKFPMWSDQSGFRVLWQQIEAFKSSLPPDLDYNEQNLADHAREGVANQFIFLHIVKHQVVLFITRFALPMSGAPPAHSADMPVEFQNRCIHAALDSAKQISELVKEASQYRVTAPFAGYSAFFSSTVHMQGLSSHKPAIVETAKQCLSWNLKFLLKMKQHWGMFHFVTEHLKDLYRRQIESRTRTASSKSDGKSSAIFQYGDWFDRYPHGMNAGNTKKHGDVQSSPREPETEVVAINGDDTHAIRTKRRATEHDITGKGSVKKRQNKSVELVVPGLRDAPQSVLTSHESTLHHSADRITPRLLQQKTFPEMDPSVYERAQHPARSSQTASESPQNLMHRSQLPTSVDSGHGYMQNLAQHPPPYIQQSKPQQQMYNSQLPGVMTEMDRQIVLSSYADVDSICRHPDLLAGTANPPRGIPDIRDLSMTPFAFGGPDASQSPAQIQPRHLPRSISQSDSPASYGSGPIDQATTGGWNDSSSSAWFMPFNLEPMEAWQADSAAFFNDGNNASMDNQFDFDAMIAAGVADFNNGMVGGYKGNMASV